MYGITGNSNPRYSRSRVDPESCRIWSDMIRITCPPEPRMGKSVGASGFCDTTVNGKPATLSIGV
ncbi:unnamed protein product [Penicillium camemberti]|uniref:Str. FM013 n=1 Tax=Penicillium camemberti (strain FM 013) TaxID=1429867 RepID=A0A0G4PRL5_PENC3|nr:unnamed protein product [Penicillium camemberti]